MISFLLFSELLGLFSVACFESWAGSGFSTEAQLAIRIVAIRIKASGTAICTSRNEADR